MQRVAVHSSSITDIWYYAESLTLEIGFHDGRVYQYFDVPENVYLEFLSPPDGSHGKYFAANIRGVYRYARL
jgi:hypothetical protein